MHCNKAYIVSIFIILFCIYNTYIFALQYEKIIIILYSLSLLYYIHTLFYYITVSCYKIWQLKINEPHSSEPVWVNRHGHDTQSKTTYNITNGTIQIVTIQTHRPYRRVGHTLNILLCPDDLKARVVDIILGPLPGRRSIPNCIVHS